MQTTPVKAFVFDAYGTLFDVHSVVALCDELFPGRGEALSRLWRAKQLEYTWLRSLMDRYEDFGRVTAAALAHACRALGLALTPDARDRLLEAYLHLAPYPETAPALAALKGRPLAILSNGSPAMLAPLLRNAGLQGAFTEVISVDEVGVYKPSPRVYGLAPQKLGVPREAIGFVSSNFWDVCGAKAFGFRVFWINRAQAVPDELGQAPDGVFGSLSGLAGH